MDGDRLYLRHSSAAPTEVLKNSSTMRVFSWIVNFFFMLFRLPRSKKSLYFQLDLFSMGLHQNIVNFAIKDERMNLLLGFSGIDYNQAMLILTELGDVTRFSNSKKIVSWVGLAPLCHLETEYSLVE